MKPFNLGQALSGAKVVTREGLEATQIVNFNTDTTKFTVHAIVQGYIESFTVEGYFYGEKAVHPKNLFIQEDLKMIECNKENWEKEGNPVIEVFSAAAGVWELIANPAWNPAKVYRWFNETKPNPIHTQVGGTHYSTKKIQPIEYILANELNFCEGSVVKYVSRHRDKGGKADLLKAIQYLEFLIGAEYGEIE